MKKFYDHSLPSADSSPLIQERQLSVTVESTGKLPRRLAQEQWIG